MSFEGYYQLVCEKGHYEEADRLDLENHGSHCEECKTHFVWSNLVNTTNSDDDWGSRVELKPSGEGVEPPKRCVFCGTFAYDHGEFEGWSCCKKCKGE